MNTPLKNPPARKTSHGVQMSDRMARLYTWLSANGVGLSDFSTDECVQRELGKLVALRDELSALRAAAEERYLNDLDTDLVNIMRRVPSARVVK
jgi:hypothetical protein